MNFENKSPRNSNARGFYLVLLFCVLAVAATAFALNNVLSEIGDISSSDKTDLSDIQSNILPQTEISDEDIKDQTPVTADAENEPYEKTQEVTANFFVYPVAGEVIKTFSDDALVFSETYKDFRTHLGLDIVPSGSTVVCAAGDGVVTDIAENTALGTVITVNHGGGITAEYCGVKNIKVAVGNTVSANTPIAEIGICPDECEDQAHLHFAMYKDGVCVSPALFLDIE